jgi:histone H3/H4
MKWKKLRERNYKEKKMTSKTADPTFQITDTAKIPKTDSDEKRAGDVTGGMELLELDFLLRVVEDTKGDDKNDVAMRRLSFDELLRRKNQDRIDSNALTVYAVNKYDLYGKNIQCEAMKELTRRTVQSGKSSS